jgi:heptosyltransferase-2
MLPTRAKPDAHIAAQRISLSRVSKSTATKTRGDHAALVVAPQWVGDAIMSLPLIEQLVADYTAVDVLAVPAVAAVYHCSPAVRNVRVVPFAHGQLQWRLRRQVARELRGQYSAAIVLPNSLKSAVVPWLAGIPIRRGMTGESRYLLLNDRRAIGQEAHRSARSRPSMLDQYLALADQPIPQSAIDRFGSHRPVMIMPTQAPSFGDHGLDPADLDKFLHQSLLAICPGAEYGPAKQWPAEHFAQVANEWLHRASHHAVIIVGGPNDIALSATIMSIIEKSSRVIDLSGKTKLLDAFWWISRCRVAVSNDSGLMHAAAALGIPVVGIFGSSDPHHTPPHAKNARALSLQLACSPCFQRVCPLGTTACLKDLSADSVTRAVNDLTADAQVARDAASRASL